MKKSTNPVEKKFLNLVTEGDNIQLKELLEEVRLSKIGHDRLKMPATNERFENIGIPKTLEEAKNNYSPVCQRKISLATKNHRQTKKEINNQKAIIYNLMEENPEESALNKVKKLLKLGNAGESKKGLLDDEEEDSPMLAIQNPEDHVIQSGGRKESELLRKISKFSLTGKNREHSGSPMRGAAENEVQPDASFFLTQANIKTPNTPRKVRLQEPNRKLSGPGNGVRNSSLPPLSPSTLNVGGIPPKRPQDIEDLSKQFDVDVQCVVKL